MSTEALSEVPPGETQPARWSRFAALGLAMIGLAAFLLLAATVVWGLDAGGELALFIALIVLPLAGAYAVTRFGTWSKVAAIVVALLALGGMFWTAFGVSLPASFFDFVPAVLVVPGAVIAIVGSVAAMVAKRRGHASAKPERGERRAIAIVAAVVGVLGVLSAVMSVAGSGTVDATKASATVVFKDFKFDRSSYDVSGGTQILVTNDDPFAHTFTIDAVGLDVTLGPREQKLIDIPSSSGTYVVYCRFHTSDPRDPTASDMASRLAIG